MGGFFFVVIALLMAVMLLFVAVFAKVFGLWIKCLMNGAGVTIPQILAMRLRKSPAPLICDLRIKAKQSGVALSAAQIERAYLQGADVEKLVDAFLYAHRTGREVTWEQLVDTDLTGS